MILICVGSAINANQHTLYWWMGTIRLNYHFESRMGFEGRSRYIRRVNDSLSTSRDRKYLVKYELSKYFAKQFVTEPHSLHKLKLHAQS
jgi:hypothetical protein